MSEEAKTQVGVSRRALFAGAGGAAVALAVCGLKALPAQARVRPPGGQDEDRLQSMCIRCARCIEACPWRLIRGAHIGEGVLGAGVPVADFNVGWCDLCTSQGGSPRCVDACPTGALSLPLDESLPIIGIAEITHDWCLPWAEGKKCKRCYRACPSQYRAIKLDKQNRPSIVPEKCVGCGACQKACLTPEKGSLAPSPDLRAVMVKPVS